MGTGSGKDWLLLSCHIIFVRSIGHLYIVEILVISMRWFYIFYLTLLYPFNFTLDLFLSHRTIFLSYCNIRYIHSLHFLHYFISPCFYIFIYWFIYFCSYAYWDLIHFCLMNINRIAIESWDGYGYTIYYITPCIRYALICSSVLFCLLHLDLCLMRMRMLIPIDMLFVATQLLGTLSIVAMLNVGEWNSTLHAYCTSSRNHWHWHWYCDSYVDRSEAMKTWHGTD